MENESYLETFDEIVKVFPELHDELVSSNKYSFGTLTEGVVRRVFNKREPISGVYIISNKQGDPLYVGRSRNMAVRLGTDHRAITKTQANFTYKLVKEMNKPVHEVRSFMYENFFVQMIEVNNDYARTLFEVYVAMKLQTPYNSFRES